MLSRPVPRTQPVTSRPFEMVSIMASSSASQRGSSQMGRMLPMRTIFARFVMRARMEASTLQALPMQKGVLWCSFRASASKPISSAKIFSSR